MRLMRRLLGFLWTFAAAAPMAARPASHADSGTAGVSAPTRSTRSDTRASLGQIRIGLGESVLRDLKTPFTAAPHFRVSLTTRTVVLDGETVRQSGSQTVRRSNRARAPPALR